MSSLVIGGGGGEERVEEEREEAEERVSLLDISSSILIKTIIMIIITITRSYAAQRAADLNWIIRMEYSPGRYILGCSQRLASCLQHSARTDILFRTSFVHLCTFS